MSFSVRANIFALTALSVSTLTAQTAPRVFLLNPATLSQQKAHPDAAIVKLAREEADKALKIGPLSVTTKGKTPPSGDKHDFMSMGRYWWPNPDTPNHLPYIRKDGEVNPEINEIADADNLDHMANTVDALALGSYLTGDARYAEHATLLLRTWFLDPATKMDPNMNFAQYVPGRNTGRGSGILDARRFALVIDAVGLLSGSRSWTPADQAGMSQWFSEYFRANYFQAYR